MRMHDAATHDEAEILLGVGQEILAVLLGLETDQIVRQHRLDQLAMVRHAADHGARRPWRMQEEADRLPDAERAQFRAEREEMIVLDPECRLRLLEAQQRARHEGVYFAIAGIVFLRGADEIGAGMQRRPQCRICEPFVIAAVMRRRQIEHRQRTGTQGFDFSERFLLVPVADPSAGTDPDRAGLLDDRQQRGCQSPRHGFVRFSTRNAVRDDDEVHKSPPVSARVNNHSSIWFLSNLSTN